MHIPDGYLGPQTYAPAYGVMVPLWAVASAKLNKTLRHRQVPLLALGAAFSFVIMMFNIQIPGSTSGHAVGGVLIAVLLGPWAAMVAVSLVLVCQALLFGDGGVTAIGANCLNIAVLMPFSGWAVYRLIARSAPATSWRHWIGAAVGGYVGLNAAALGTAVMFGIQPLIAQDSAGRALYCPFGLSVAVPVMAATHLLVFGFVEAAVTGLVVAYLQRVEPTLIKTTEKAPAARPARISLKKLAVALALLVLLSPLGLYLPEKLGGEPAYGEWSATEVGRMAGYIPQGMRKLESLWPAPMPDYAPPGQESAPATAMSAYYLACGAAGTLLLVGGMFGLRRLLAQRERNERDT